MKLTTTLATSTFLPEQPKAVLVVVHGMAEHRKRYIPFAEKMQEAGFGVVLYDQKGHGESVHDASELGYFGSQNGYLNLVEDVHSLVKQVKEQLQVPVVIFGHSMGSMVSRCFVKRYDTLVDAIVLSGAPNYTPAAPAGKLVAQLLSSLSEKKRSALLHNMAEGGFIKAVENPKTEVDWLSYDEDNVKRYLEDPLCGFTFTNRGYVDLMSMMMDMHDVTSWKCNHSDLPILFVSGKDDPCTGGTKGLEDSIATLQQAGYQNIENKVFENARHEILNEKLSGEVITEVQNWLEKVLKQA